jgi:hypothetical protein
MLIDNYKFFKTLTDEQENQFKKFSKEFLKKCLFFLTKHELIFIKKVWKKWNVYVLQSRT